MSNSIHNSISKAGGDNTYPVNGKEIKRIMNTATVFSSHGEITMDKPFGTVIDFNNEAIRKEYGSIVSFDVAEYCRYWNEELADCYDILDLGSWDKDGNYTAADEDFRADLKAQTA